MKIFVITDERCGGTQLGNIFTLLGFNVIDDPQTHKYNKEYVLNNLTNIFNEYNYVKICMVSYNIEEYIKLIESIPEDCVIILLWRKNNVERALSKYLAERTGVWHQDNEKYRRKLKRITVDIGTVDKYIIENNHKFELVKNYLNKIEKKYYSIAYENLYDPKFNADQRYVILCDILGRLGVSTIIDDNKKIQIRELLSPKKKLNSYESYMLVSNINSVMKHYKL